MTRLKRTARTVGLLCILALVLAVMGGSLWAAAGGPGDQPEYTVASKEVQAVASGTTVAARAASLRGVSERLTLLAVGGLLLGLAAAVRRTT